MRQALYNASYFVEEYFVFPIGEHSVYVGNSFCYTKRKKTHNSTVAMRLKNHNAIRLLTIFK